MPADPNLWDAVKIGGGTVTGAIVAAFIKNFFTNDGKDAREFRTEYRIEIERLHKKLEAFEAKLRGLEHDHRVELDDMDRQLRELARTSMHYMTSRAEARAMLNTRERLAGEPITTWPPDPGEKT